MHTQEMRSKLIDPPLEIKVVNRKDPPQKKVQGTICDPPMHHSGSNHHHQSTKLHPRDLSVCGGHIDSRQRTYQLQQHHVVGNQYADDDKYRKPSSYPPPLQRQEYGYDQPSLPLTNQMSCNQERRSNRSPNSPPPPLAPLDESYRSRGSESKYKECSNIPLPYEHCGLSLLQDVEQIVRSGTSGREARRPSGRQYDRSRHSYHDEVAGRPHAYVQQEDDVSIISSLTERFLPRKLSSSYHQRKLVERPHAMMTGHDEKDRRKRKRRSNNTGASSSVQWFPKYVDTFGMNCEFFNFVLLLLAIYAFTFEEYGFGGSKSPTYRYL